MIAEHDDGKICDAIVAMALSAGREIMRIYDAGITVDHKADSSPVTQADRQAEAMILAELNRQFPATPAVAEEAASQGNIPGDIGTEFFLVDPLDGTREFVNQRTDFTVNIALIRDGTPVVGVVYAPARHELFCAHPSNAHKAKTDSGHKVETWQRIRVRACGEPPRILASRSHRTPETDAFIANIGASELVSVGSSLKFCMLAAGEADIYPRFGRTMEWDTAAGDAVLRAAGGSTTLTNGQPLRYGKRNQADDVDFANPYFIAIGAKDTAIAR